MDQITVFLLGMLLFAIGVIAWLATVIDRAADKAADIRRRIDDINAGLVPPARPFPGEADIERQIDAIIREAQDA